MTDPSYRMRCAFERVIEERHREMDELVAELTSAMAKGEDNIRQRLKTPRLNTTPPAIREAALKKRMTEKLDRLSEMAPKLAALLLSLYLDEVELGLALDTRRQAASDYWKRLSEGRIYAGARHFLDMLAEHRIDAVALATLNQAETHEITRYMQSVLERKWSQ